jgi:16S rRNA (cytidine1402-2'-O)-methyltransferase
MTSSEGTTAGRLELVGTPIGNLGDLSDRARQALSTADLIAAEDTRRTGRLLRSLGIATPMRSMFEGNERERVDELLALLRAGRTVAVVTDGGMPSISDPGFPLVRACVDAGVEVVVVPGPTAAIAALVVSGLPTDRFVFEGFLPRTAGQRRRRLEALADDPRTVLVYESPKRVRRLLEEVVEVLGDRPVALCRELTKLHEEVIRGTASEVLARLGGSDPRGEVVLVVGSAPPEDTDATERLEAALAEARGRVGEGAKKRAAAREAATRHGVSANDVYAALLTGTPTG